jgi:spore coat polysaccharide biosynthesis predicted glycosyltransferase SpsG
LLDSILIINKQIKQLEGTKIPIIFIDDEKRRNVLNNGFIVDWTVLSDKKDYFNPKKQNVKYLLGSNYAPLRKLFNSADKIEIKDAIKSIMITFGGSDVKNITPKILNLLVNSYPNIIKNIIIGSGFNNIIEIENLKDNNTNLIFNANENTMVDIMQKSDLAIASGGQTLYELALIGIPTIAILVVKNAQDDTTGWHEAGSLINAGWENDENLENNILKFIIKLNDKKLRLEMQENANKYIKQNGAKRLVDGII